MSQVAPGGHNKPVVRALIAGVAACAVWYYADRPVQQNLKSRRAALVKAGGEVAINEQTATDEGDLLATIGDMRTRRDELYAQAAKSADMTGLYDSFRKLAIMEGVRIERIEPSASQKLPVNHALADREPVGETFGYAVEVSGAYEAIARFIDACERELGTSRVGRFRLSTNGPTPAGAEPVLTALVETVHLKLTPRVAAAGEQP